MSLVGSSSAWFDRQRIKSFSRSDKSTINANDHSISNNVLSSFRLGSLPLVALVEVTFGLITFSKSGSLSLVCDRDLSVIREQVLLSFSSRITYDVESA